MKTKILASLTGLLVSFLAPLAVLVPQASAAAITWSGLGTVTVDSVAKTRSFNISDTANWVGGVAPVAGDSMVFPANLAPVDPTSAVTDDYSWSYVINNDLTAGTDIAGITFSGDTGTDCAVIDDRYTFGGNEISLSGDVTNSYTGNCATMYSNRFDLPILTSASITFDADISNLFVSSVASLNYGVNNFSFCDTADIARSSKNLNVYDAVFTGTGTLTISCGTNNLSYAYSSVVGPIVVESNSQMSGNLLNIGKETGKTVTFNSGATFSLYDQAQGAVIDFKRDIIFVGAGSSTEYCKSTTCTGADSVSVTGYRGYVDNYKYNSTLEKNEHFPVTFSGDITLSSATMLTINSNTTVTGAISGNFAIGSVPGSRGDLILQSSDNQSATANGTIKPETVDYKLFASSFPVYLQFGQVGIVQPDEEITELITVAEGSILKGAGTVAGIDVQVDGTLAPGNSPGCIVSNGDLTLAGSYDVEIAGTTACTEHDQTDVTGAVDVSGGTLNTSLLDGFVPALNDEFIIIKNDAAEAVTGEFTGMADGSSFDVAGVTFQINYDGGDGNDVTLTATAVPATVTTPDTGIGEIMQSPILTLVAVLLSAGMLVGLKRIQSAK